MASMSVIAIDRRGLAHVDSDLGLNTTTAAAPKIEVVAETGAAAAAAASSPDSMADKPKGRKSQNHVPLWERLHTGVKREPVTASGSLAQSPQTSAERHERLT